MLKVLNNIKSMFIYYSNTYMQYKSGFKKLIVIQVLEVSIEADLPVIVGLKNSSGGTHFVAAYGYGGDTIFINDPASSKDYTELDEYLTNNYVNRLYVYSNN